MGIIILASAITVLGIILLLCLRFADKAWLFVVGVMFSCCGGVFLVGMLLSLMTREADFAYYEDQYNNLKEQLTYVVDDDIVTGENLRNQVLEMNNAISKHKRYSKNYWVNIWWSEDIGNLEPLKWKSEKQK